MKRIAEHVAVQTILYTIHPLQMIEIIDYDNTYRLSEDIDGHTVYHGTAGESYKHLNSKHDHAMVRRIGTSDGTLQIRICLSADVF